MKQNLKGAFMKFMTALLILASSLSSFAQERVELNKKTVSINSDNAIIVRTANTPKKVEIILQVPMANSYCAETRQQYYPRTCHRSETQYQTRRVCRDVVVSRPAPSNNPRGPRYNPPTQTRRECRDERVVVGTRRYAYDCSYYQSYCARYETGHRTESDKVKITFKNLPKLGGSEEDSFEIRARQRTYDGSNVVYDITPLETVEDYEVQSKGILGFDSYVIKKK